MENVTPVPKVVVFAREQVGVSEKNNEYTKYTQGRKEPWCMNFMSYVFEKTHNEPPFGYRTESKEYVSQVSKIKEWGEKNGNFKPAESLEEISSQIPKMKAGDMVIFKKDVDLNMESTGGDCFQRSVKSHVGMVHKVDPQNLSVNVIEGNANEYVRNEKAQILLTQNFSKTDAGLQRVSITPAVINKYDSVMEKIYTPQMLFNQGFVGYIDMQKEIEAAEAATEK